MGQLALAQGRIIAIGDIHGAYPRFVSMLEKVGLIDAKKQWTGGSTTLVQVGDALDRDPHSRDVLELLMALEAQAPKTGGKVIPLLGNHEVMNVLGHLRSVTVEEYGAFSTPKSKEVREKSYQEWRSFLEISSKRKGQPVPDEEADRKSWMKEHPLGYFEHREAYGPEGHYGRWLRKHDAVAVVGDAVFSHAGVNPDLQFKTVADLNERVHNEFKTFDSVWKTLVERKIIWKYWGLKHAMREAEAILKLRGSRGAGDDPEADKAMKILIGALDWYLMSEDGPMWFRGYAHKKKQQANLRRELEPMLNRLKVSKIVMGHSPTKSHRIENEYDKLLFRIDTRMQDAEEGQAAALEILNGTYTAYYVNGPPEVLLKK